MGAILSSWIEKFYLNIFYLDMYLSSFAHYFLIPTLSLCIAALYSE